LLETEAWRFVSDKAYIGIYNDDTTIADRSYTIRVTEVKEEDLLSEDLKPKYQIYERVFQDIDAATVS
jgi:hypothetical protein